MDRLVRPEARVAAPLPAPNRGQEKSVGFRNIAVHDYETIDWDLVYEIAIHHTRDFAEFAKAVASRLDA